MGQMFGKPFFRENGDTAPSLWDQAISRLSDQQVSSALANLGNDGLKFPPNLSMFIEAAKRQKPVRHLGVKELPAPPEIEAEKAWAHMEKLAGRKLRPEA